MLALNMLALTVLSLEAAEANNDDYEKSDGEDHDNWYGGVSPPFLIVIVLCGGSCNWLSRDERRSYSVQCVGVGLNIAIRPDSSVIGPHLIKCIHLGRRHYLYFLTDEPFDGLVAARSGQTSFIVVDALRYPRRDIRA